MVSCGCNYVLYIQGRVCSLFVPPTVISATYNVLRIVCLRAGESVAGPVGFGHGDMFYA